jgi:hypothetical protein
MKHTLAPSSTSRRPRVSQAAEDCQGIARDGLPDDLAARLDFAVDARRERLGVPLRRGADDEVPPAALDGVPLSLEFLRELLRRVVRGEGDPDLPRREAAVELLLFPGLALRLVFPALLGVEPALDPARLRLGSRCSRSTAAITLAALRPLTLGGGVDEEPSPSRETATRRLLSSAASSAASSPRSRPRCSSAPPWSSTSMWILQSSAIRRESCRTRPACRR